MARVLGCHLKIIDFNHSRMFNLADSPIRIQCSRTNLKANLTDQEAWKTLAEQPSPALPNPHRKVGQFSAVSKLTGESPSSG